MIQFVVTVVFIVSLAVILIPFYKRKDEKRLNEEFAKSIDKKANK